MRWFRGLAIILMVVTMAASSPAATSGNSVASRLDMTDRSARIMNRAGVVVFLSDDTIGLTNAAHTGTVILDKRGQLMMLDRFGNLAMQDANGRIALRTGANASKEATMIRELMKAMDRKTASTMGH